MRQRMQQEGNYLSKVDDVFNFLKENKSNWEIKNNRVEFKSMSQVTKYNSLITMVNTAASRLK